MKKAKEAGDITEDDLHRGHDRVQKLTDATVARIDKVLAAKEAEIMEV
jgi:ribosome recycling factor